MTTPEDEVVRDPLTGLISLAAAERQIAAWQDAASESGTPRVSALLLRLRRFSSVNLAFGAATGDRALMEIAARIVRFCGAGLGSDALIARAGGGAFLIAAEQVCSRNQWEELAEELARKIACPIVDPSGVVVRVRPRMALVQAARGEPAERVLGGLADTLDRTQDRPGGSLCWVNGDEAFGGLRAQQLEADLLGALERSEIELLFQPQYAAGDNRLIGAEALARWRHPQLGRIGAAGLFAVAARADHLAPVSRHIARAALAAASHWPSDLRLSLNVSAADLASTSFARDIEGSVAAAGFSPDRLTLEITEESLVFELDRSAQQLTRLAGHGIHVALDDFGAGFCNFSYLKRLPLHALKLDRSMVEGIPQQERDLAVFRGILAMARALNLSVTAEGVENESQLAAISQEGCFAWQGFYGSPPMTIRDFAALAHRG